MKILRLISLMMLCEVVAAGPLFAQQNMKLGENAALRYWSAFAEMQDSTVSEQQARELNAILDGTSPYDDSKYKELVEKNEVALETMARGTTIPNCDWGIDYALGADAPVEYVRKSLALGRLNVLYAFHLLLTGDKDRAVRVLAAGMRFSRDVANGGTLFATVAAKSLLTAHLNGVAFALHVGGLSAEQKLLLQKVLTQFGPDGLDWQAGLKREFELPAVGLDTQASLALTQIIPAYLSVLNSPSTLPKLQQMIAAAPQPLPNIIPNPKRVLDEKQNLTDKLLQIRSLLR